MRKPAMSAPDVVPERKRSTPINPANTIRKCLSNNPVSQRPYRDRIIHLLALRSYKKLEVLARLQRDGVSQKDRSSLGSTLQQVRGRPPGGPQGDDGCRWTRSDGDVMTQMAVAVHLFFHFTFYFLHFFLIRR